MISISKYLYIYVYVSSGRMDVPHGRWLSLCGKKWDKNCTKMVPAILNKSWKQHPTKQQLYSHLPPICKTHQIRWTKHMGLCWRSKNELISNVLLWTPSHRYTSVGQPNRSYLKQLCTDTGFSLEVLPEVLNDRNEWQQRIREISTDDDYDDIV